MHVVSFCFFNLMMYFQINIRNCFAYIFFPFIFLCVCVCYCFHFLLCLFDFNFCLWTDIYFCVIFKSCVYFFIQFSPFSIYACSHSTNSISPSVTVPTASVPVSQYQQHQSLCHSTNCISPCVTVPTASVPVSQHQQHPSIMSPHQQHQSLCHSTNSISP